MHKKWKWETKTYYAHTHTHTCIHSHTLKPSGSALETMQKTECIETVSLLQFCNLFTEGHILCSARERALNTASFLMPLGFVLCVLICVFVLPKSESVWEKEAVRKVEVEDFVFWEMMMNWQRNAVPCMFGQGDQGGQTGMSDEGCETVTVPQGTWSELFGMCLHHQQCQLTLRASRNQAYSLYVVNETSWSIMVTWGEVSQPYTVSTSWECSHSSE